MSILNRVIDKCLSARFIVTVFLVNTYCFVVWESIHLVKEKLLTVETFLALIAGFSSVVTLVIKSYFDRIDRGGVNEKNIT